MSYTKGVLLPPTPSTSRGQSTKLGLDPVRLTGTNDVKEPQPLALTKGERIIYCNSRSVFILSLSGNQPNVAYSGHPKETTAAKISPSGYYAASADVSGTVRVWDLVGDEQILKSEVKALGGRINALAWDSESKRIIVGGDGRDRFAHAFSFDSGSSVGELSGHSKIINAVAIRQQRPFRAVTGGDDRTLVFSHGVPYKYAKTLTEHSGFVQDVAFSPSGDHFASVGADSKLLLYNGSTGDYISSLSSADKDGHKGGIFALSWAKDSKFISTSGADRTVKIWDVERQAAVQTWSFGDAVESQQVGNVWSAGSGEEIVSLSLSGDLNILDKRTSSGPVKVLYGHQRAITAISDKLGDQPTFYSGSYDGKINRFELSGDKGECYSVTGSGHTNAVVGISSDSRGNAYTAGMDDTVREIFGKEGFSSRSMPTGSQPSALAVDGQGAQIVATATEVQVVQDGKKSGSISVPYKPSNVAISSQALLAVGGSDGKVYLYSSASLKPHTVAALDKNKGTITALGFSHDGQYLAAGDSNGKIIVYSMPDGELKTASWVFHTAKITSIKWSPSSLHAVSGSLDTNVYVWSIQKPMKNIGIKGAHAGGVSGVSFVDEDTVVSVGADAAFRSWKVKHHVV